MAGFAQKRVFFKKIEAVTSVGGGLSLRGKIEYKGFPLPKLKKKKVKFNKLSKTDEILIKNKRKEFESD